MAKPTMAGKDQRKVMTAVARELLGFIWAIGIKTGSGLQCNQWRHDPDQKNKSKDFPK